MQAQLNTLSKVGAWGDVEKPQQDMAFLLISPSTDSGAERFFGIVMVWAHPCQACYHNLEVAAHKLVLLADGHADWPYIFIQMSDTVSHVPLSSEGHQHHDRWHAQCRSLWLAPPAADM